MAGTLIVAVRVAVVEGLAALPAYTTKVNGHRPHVSLGWPVGKKDREKVFTQSATFTHEPASMKSGRTFRNEQGRFEVVVWVEGVGENQETTSERAVTLGTAFEEYVADHKNSLGVAGLNWVVVDGDGRLDEAFNDRGSLAQLIYTVRYDARLT